MEQLKPDEMKIIHEYLRNGNNATQAVLKIKPHVTKGSAEVIGSKVLGTVKAKMYMEEVLKEDRQSVLPAREEVLTRLKDIANEAREKGQYAASVSALREYARIKGLYDQQDSGMNQYYTFINQLIQNVEVKKQPQLKQGDGAFA